METGHPLLGYVVVDEYGQIHRVLVCDFERGSGVEERNGKQFLRVPIPREVVDDIKTQHAAYRWDHDSQQLVKRLPVSMTVSSNLIEVSGDAFVEAMVLGLPDGVERVRLEVNQREFWLHRESGLFLLRLHSARSATVTLRLCDARFVAPAPIHVVRFVEPEQEETADGS